MEAKMKALLCIFFVLLLTAYPALAGGNREVRIYTYTYRYTYREREVPVNRYVEVPVESRIYLQPVTAPLVRELKSRGAVSNFQYFISSPLVLINDMPGTTRVTNNLGALGLTRDFSGDIVIVEAKIRGDVIGATRKADGRMVLVVSFEQERSNKGLRFIESRDGYFDLEITNGVTMFGDRRYRVHGGVDALTRPRLMVNVHNSILPIEPRILHGRDIEADRANTPVRFPISHPLPNAPVPPPPESNSNNHTATQPRPPAPPREPTPPPAPRPEPPYQIHTHIHNHTHIHSHNHPQPPPISHKYDIQVGAFRVRNSANGVFQTLRGMGLSPVIQPVGGLYRVIVPRVPAAQRDATIQKLRLACFPDTFAVRNKN